MYNNKKQHKKTKKHKNKKKKNLSWGLTHSPTSEFFPDFWILFNLTKPLSRYCIWRQKLVSAHLKVGYFFLMILHRYFASGDVATTCPPLFCMAKTALTKQIFPFGLYSSIRCVCKKNVFFLIKINQMYFA